MATDEPIVVEIRVKVAHEVRLKLDREVAALVSAERNRAEIGGRGLDDLPPLVLDSKELLDAKARGEVGETGDGYVASVGAGSCQAALLQRVNDRRRAEYQNLAALHEASLRDVETIAGARRLREVTPGEMYRAADGIWHSRSMPEAAVRHPLSLGYRFGTTEDPK